MLCDTDPKLYSGTISLLSPFFVIFLSLATSRIVLCPVWCPFLSRPMLDFLFFFNFISLFRFIRLLRAICSFRSYKCNIHTYTYIGLFCGKNTLAYCPVTRALSLLSVALWARDCFFVLFFFGCMHFGHLIVRRPLIISLHVYEYI